MNITSNAAMLTPNHTLKVFGQNVRKQRLALGLSQRRLAQKAKLDRSYLSDIERGLRDARLDMAEQIAKGLGTSLAVLFDGVDQPPRS
jgi:transcriptional regulator with XRE-family HTH domain